MVLTDSRAPTTAIPAGPAGVPTARAYHRLRMIRTARWMLVLAALAASVSVVSVVDQGSVSLSAPRPNPSAGTVALDFVLPREGHAVVTVFDPQGRRVRRLAEGAWGAGRHRTGSRQQATKRLQQEGEIVS